MTDATVICPYLDKCSNKDNMLFSCNTCRHNTGKRNYYEPDTNPIPYFPPPYNPPLEIPYPYNPNYGPWLGCVIHYE